MNPDQIPLVKTLDNNISKVTIDSCKRRPELGFASSIAVDGALGYVIHAVFGVFGGMVLINVVFGRGFGGVCVDSGRAGIDVGYVVEDGPEDAFAKSVVPALFCVLD